MVTFETSWTDGDGPHLVSTTQRPNESVESALLRHLSDVAEELAG